MIRKLTALTATLALALAITAPALAQEPEVPAAGETVTVTFQLDFEGEVPGWQDWMMDPYDGALPPISERMHYTNPY